MDYTKLGELVKKAALSDGLSLLPKLTDDFKIPELKEPELPQPKIQKPPELPKLKEIKPLKLDTGIGKSKPAFTHELKTNSPYNEK